MSLVLIYPYTHNTSLIFDSNTCWLGHLQLNNMFISLLELGLINFFPGLLTVFTPTHTHLPILSLRWEVWSLWLLQEAISLQFNLQWAVLPKLTHVFCICLHACMCNLLLKYVMLEFCLTGYCIRDKENCTNEFSKLLGLFDVIYSV